MARTGRPTICTPEKIKEICAHLEVGCPVEDACALSGITETTYSNWKVSGAEGRQPYQNFLCAVNTSRAKIREHYLGVIKSACSDKSFNWLPAAWFLERTDRRNFGRYDLVKVEQTTTVLAVDILKELEP